MATQHIKSEIELYVIGRVRELRTELKLSQAQLAILIDVSVGFIGHVESPKHRAKYNLNHINRLVKVLNCEFKDLFPAEPI